MLKPCLATLLLFVFVSACKKDTTTISGTISATVGTTNISGTATNHVIGSATTGVAGCGYLELNAAGIDLQLLDGCNYYATSYTMSAVGSGFYDWEGIVTYNNKTYYTGSHYTGVFTIKSNNPLIATFSFTAVSIPSYDTIQVTNGTVNIPGL